MAEIKYSNIAMVNLNPLDAQLHFGIREQNMEPGKVIDETIIMMSLQHAKAFSQVLEKSLQEYEKKFGEIVLPTEEANVEKTEEERILPLTH